MSEPRVPPFEPQNKQRPSTRSLIISFSIGIAILITIAVSSLFIVRTGNNVQPQPTPTHNPTVVTAGRTPVINLPLSSIDIVVDAPPSVQLNQSYIFTVSLAPKGQPLFSHLQIEKATATASDTIAMGTPGTTLGNAFGPGYEPSATATLSPNDGPLKINPIGPTVQSLNQQEVTWKWTVVPAEVGTDILDVDIEATWKSQKLGFQGPYRLGDKQFIVEVKAAPPTQGITSSSAPQTIDWGPIATVLAAFIGAGALIVVALIQTPQFRRRFKSPSRSAKPKSSRSKNTPP